MQHVFEVVQRQVREKWAQRRSLRYALLAALFRNCLTIASTWLSLIRRATFASIRSCRMVTNVPSGSVEFD